MVNDCFFRAPVLQVQFLAEEIAPDKRVKGSLPHGRPGRGKLIREHCGKNRQTNALKKERFLPASKDDGHSDRK